MKLEYKFSKRAQQRRKFEKRYRRLFGNNPDKKRVEHFIKEGRAAAKKRFEDEFQASFGKRPTENEVEKFVVDWRTQKTASCSEESKLLFQRGQLTSLDAKRLDSLVFAARSYSHDKAEQIDANSSEQEQRAQKQENKRGRKSEEVHEQRTKASRSRRRRTRTQIENNSIGRMEAIRRMKRGMDIARAIQGNPSAILIRQLTALSRRKNENESRREKQTIL